MKNKMFYGWRIVIAGLLMITITVPFTSALVSLYMIPVTTEFDIPRSAFTLTTTIVSTCSILLSPMVGLFIQKYNIKKVLAGGLIVFALSYMSYGLAQSVYHLYLSALGVGLAFTFCGNLPIQIIIVNWFNKSRGLALSIAVAGIGLGGFIFSPIIANLIMNFGWRQTYFMMGLAILAVGLPMILFVMKKSPAEIGLKPYGENEGDNVETTKAAVKTSQKTQIDIDMPSETLTKQSSFYIYMFGIFALGIVTSGSLQQLNPFMSDLHGMSFAATIVSMFSLLGIFGKLLLGQLSDKIGVIKAGNLGYLAMIIAFGLLLFGENKIALIVMALFLSLGNAVAGVSIPLYASHVFGFKNSGIMMGLSNSAFQIGMAIGGVLTGAVYDVLGSYQWAWIGLVVLSFLSAACVSIAYQIAKNKYPAQSTAQVAVDAK